MRIGVFGGTFDPVHYGHVRTVARAAREFELEGVLWVPARLSPHKGHAPTDPRHRVAMLALALQGHPDWSLWLEELDRDPPSYTVDSLAALSARGVHDELWLLMGTDTLATLDRWKDPEEIVRLAHVASFYREPFSGSGLRVPPVAGLSDRLHVFDAGSVKISGTELRNAIARGESLAGQVPDPVAEYITKQALYRPGAART